MEVRPLLDELIVEKASDYIKRSGEGGQAVLHLRRPLAHAPAGDGPP